jgi:hypothetical protein
MVLTIIVPCIIMFVPQSWDIFASLNHGRLSNIEQLQFITLLLMTISVIIWQYHEQIFLDL